MSGQFLKIQDVPKYSKFLCSTVELCRTRRAILLAKQHWAIDFTGVYTHHWLWFSFPLKTLFVLLPALFFPGPPEKTFF